MIYGLDNTLQKLFFDIREWYDVYVMTFNVTEVQANQTFDAIGKYERAARGKNFLNSL